jgi:hypothetical protein
LPEVNPVKDLKDFSMIWVSSSKNFIWWLKVCDYIFAAVLFIPIAIGTLIKKGRG